MIKYWILALLLPFYAKAQDMNTEHEIYFDATKASLRDSAQNVLKNFAQMAKNKTDQRIQVTAHTDNVGSEEENQLLAARRADSVRLFLQNQGIAEDRIAVEAVGESAPLVPNTNAANKQRNRRVEVRLMSKAGGILTVHIRDASNQKPVAATLELSENGERYPITIGPSGTFSTHFKGGTKGLAEVQSKGYFFDSQTWAVEENDTTVLRFELQPVEQDAALELKIFFYGGRATILPKSRPELNRLKEFVEQNKDLELEIAGHVNVPNTPPVPTSSQHYKLSEARAKVVKDFLVQQGVDAKRITAKGYGNSQMLFPEAVAEREQARNRRVEVRVVGIKK